MGPGQPCLDPDEPEPCETDHPVIDALGFQAGADDAWVASNAADPDPYARRERGGWIMRDPATGATSIFPFPGATYTACGIDLPPGAVPPANAIGMFHTHPWAAGDFEACEPCRRLRAEQQFPGLDRSYIDTLLDGLPQGTEPNMTYEGIPSREDVDAVRNIAAKFGRPDFVGVMADRRVRRLRQGRRRDDPAAEHLHDLRRVRVRPLRVAALFSPPRR